MKARWLMLGVAAVVCWAPHSSAQERIGQERVALTEAQAAGGGVKTVLPSRARVPMEAQTIKGAPYTAELLIESVQVLSDGNRIVKKTTGRVYRDSQGRTRREEDREPGTAGSVSISDPVANVAYSMDPNSRIAWKTAFRTAGAIAMRIPPPPPPAPADPADLERRKVVEATVISPEASGMIARPGVQPLMKTAGPGHYDQKMEKLPARSIEGVMAEGTRITRTIPAGAIGNEQPIVTVTEEWRSPELQALVLTRTSDPRTGEYTYKLLNINRAEPNQSWFEVPADYSVRESGISKLEAVRK